MRLISQEGKIDVPYEMGSLIVNGGMITYYNYSCQKGTVMAVYRSEERAMKVMEMVINTYSGVVLFQNVEVTEEAMEILKKAKLQGIISATDGKSSVEYFGNTVFQFPKDSEVEV